MGTRRTVRYGEVGAGLDFDENRLPATRRAVRWMLGILAVAGAVDGLGPVAADGGQLVGRTVADVVLTSLALAVPWLACAVLLPYRPRLATGMAAAMAVVTVPRQLWQLWLLGSRLAADGRPLFPELVPRLVIVGLVLLTLWLAYLSRARGHWEGRVTPLTRRALVPVVMALLWTVGPIADPVPGTGREAGILLPSYLADPLASPDPWLFLGLHAVPVLVLAGIGIGRHRRIAGAGMMTYGVAMLLLVLAEYLRGLELYGSSLLPLGGITFLGLASLIVIGHQWATEWARFAEPGRVPEHPGDPLE